MFAVPENTVVLAAEAGLRHPVRVALEFAARRERWRDLLRYDPDERFSTRIAVAAGEEVWLMGWLPGQQTDLHDHARSTGAFTVVSGGLVETVARGTATQLNVLSAGQSRVFGPGYVHQVRNDGPDPAISIHVYRSGRAMRPYHFDPVSGPVRD